MTRFVSDSDRAALESALLAILKVEGPLFSRDLADRIGRPQKSIIQFLIDLNCRGQVMAQTRVCAGKSARLWFWVTDGPLPGLEGRMHGPRQKGSKHKNARKFKKTPCDLEHEVWMAHWRARGEARKRQRALARERGWG